MAPIVREAWVGGREQEPDNNGAVTFLHKVYYGFAERDSNAEAPQAWLGQVYPTCRPNKGSNVKRRIQPLEHVTTEEA